MSQSPSQPGSFDTDVLIVGAGPTGLTLATALAARGIRASAIDQLSQGANTSRAAVVHARTLEVLEPLGVSRALDERGLRRSASRSAIATACWCRSPSKACPRVTRTP